LFWEGKSLTVLGEKKKVDGLGFGLGFWLGLELGLEDSIEKKGSFYLFLVFVFKKRTSLAFVFVFK